MLIFIGGWSNTGTGFPQSLWSLYFGGIQNLTGHSPKQPAVIVNFALSSEVGLDLPRSASWILQQNH